MLDGDIMEQEWNIRTSNKRCRHRTPNGKCRISIDYGAECEHIGCVIAID